MVVSCLFNAVKWVGPKIFSSCVMLPKSHNRALGLTAFQLPLNIPEKTFEGIHEICEYRPIIVSLLVKKQKGKQPYA
jgi:hypothetical protein